MNLLTERVHRSSVERLFDNVTFIVFNYDRCLEHFLVRILTDYYTLPEPEAHEIVRKVRIFHPYGQVGFLPWQVPQQGVAFGQTSGVDLLRVAAQIKTFTEKIDEPAPLAAMRDALADCHQVVFLGFAYHAQNLQLITPPGKVKVSRVFGTCMGISADEMEIIEADLARMFPVEGADQRIRFVDGECSELIRDNWRGLSA